MKNICIVITARPSYSRIKSVMIALKKHKQINLKVVVTASSLLERYGKVADVIKKDGFDVEAEAFSIIEGGSLPQSVSSVGLSLIELSSIFSRIKPDFVVTIADRYETIANAIAASYMNIPLIHIQGGEFTGSIDNKVRHAITKLADLHFVASSVAMKRVIAMGEDPEFVFNTGCPSIDIAKEVLETNFSNFKPFESYSGTGPLLDLSKGYVVVMQHPVTTEHEEASIQVKKTLNAMKRLNKPILWFWPNVDAGSDATSKVLRVFREKEPNNNFHFIKNMKPKDFLKLLLNSSCLVGNSSVGIRECAFLGVPVVNIGTRQNGRERCVNVIDVDYEEDSIYLASQDQIRNGKYKSSNTYGSGNSGEKIAEIISKIEVNVEKKDFLHSLKN